MPLLAEQNQAVHEKTVCSMLRFIRNVVLWADPETCRGDTEPALVELQQLAQTFVNGRQLPRGMALPRLIDASVHLLVAAASNGPAKGDLVPNVAEVLRALFSGPFEYQVTVGIPASIRSLRQPTSNLSGDSELQRTIQQLKMEKADNRRFTKSVIGIAEKFATALRRAQPNS